MIILVTGAAGFVGYHLVNRLLDDGHSVIGLDNLSTGHNIIRHPNYRFYRYDVTIPYDFKCDWIFNLACPASPIHYQKDPIKTMKTNVLGSINALDCAFRYKSRILQASTSETYGEPLKHPQDETYNGNVNPIGIRSCYDEGKRAAESLFMDYHRKKKVDTRIVRIFNTYGTHMNRDDGRVISNFINQALQDKDITVYGGQQTRSFMYVTDLINGLLTVMNSDIHTPVNLGNPEEYTIEQIAKKIVSRTKSTSKLKYLNVPEDDPTRRRPDITLARSLGWKPEVILDSGLKHTVDYFRRLN